jgi:hypothetical protein
MGSGRNARQSGLSAAGAIRGQVSGFQQRFEVSRGHNVSVWDFRLERFDTNDVALPRIPVEMRGLSFDGAILNGDTVEVSGHWRDGKTLRVEHVRNLATGAVISAAQPSRAGRFFAVLFTLVFLAAFVAAALFIASSVHKPG